MSALYSNPVSLSQQVLDALIFQLSRITKANGYYTDIGDILTEIPKQSDLVNYPTVVLLMGKELIDNQDQAEQLWHNMLPVGLLCFIKSESTPTQDRLAFKADLQKMFGTNWMLPGEDGLERCRETTLVSYEPFGMFANIPPVGFTLEIMIRYAQEITDPSVGA